MAASSFLLFTPYFYFRFGRKWPSVTVFAVFALIMPGDRFWASLEP